MYISEFLMNSFIFDITFTFVPRCSINLNTSFRSDLSLSIAFLAFSSIETATLTILNISEAKMVWNVLEEKYTGKYPLNKVVNHL